MMRQLLSFLVFCGLCLPVFGEDALAKKGGAILTSLKNTAIVPSNAFQRSGPLLVGEIEGVELTGSEDAAFNLYLTNGLAIYGAGQLQCTIDRFRQIPFTPSQRDMEFEPSRSDVVITLNYGYYGFWRTPARAASDFVVKTPLARLRIEAAAGAFWVLPGMLAVYLDNGVAYFEIIKTGFKETLQSGQYLILKQENIEKPYPPLIERATAVEKNQAQDWIKHARWPYERIRFEQDAQGAIQPKIYLPAGHFLQRSVGDPNL